MSKKVQVFARVEEEEGTMLEELMKITRRNKSDMVGWLIRSGYERHPSGALIKAIQNTGAKRISDKQKYYNVLCPFHDDHHPSLWFSESGYICVSCGETGTLDKLNAHYESLQLVGESDR